MKSVRIFLAASVISGVGLVAMAPPASAATCLGLAQKPYLDGDWDVSAGGNNRVSCSGTAANITNYSSLQWRRPDGVNVEVAYKRTYPKVGGGATNSLALRKCNGNTPTGYTTKGTTFINGTLFSSARSELVVLNCGI